jgi:hypothetical protein
MQIAGTVARVTGANRGIDKAFGRGGETLVSDTRPRPPGRPRRAVWPPTARARACPCWSSQPRS